MSVTLRLSPAHPPLWRDEHTLQLGIDTPVLISDPTSWQLAVIHALENGITPTDLERLLLAAGASADSGAVFLVAIDAAVVRDEPRHDVAVTLVAGAADHAAARAFADALVRADVRITADARVVFVLTPVAVMPRTTTTWMAEDRVHVPIIVGGDEITVGPVIIPGRTACAQCLAQTRREADAAWPALAAQFIEHLVPPPATTYAQAAVTALTLLGDTTPDAEESRSVTISGSNRRSWSTHRPHADCGCRSLGGTVTAFASSVLLPAPTTAPASSRRA